MPEPMPTQNQLSEPVEPFFRHLLEKVADESYDYGLKKYGTPLMTFNGRREIMDLFEEMVSAARYAVQLEMRCQKLEKLLSQTKVWYVLLPSEKKHQYMSLFHDLQEAIDA